MQTRRFVKYAGGAFAFGMLASAVAIGAVAPVDHRDAGAAPAPADAPPSLTSVQNATGRSAARSGGFTPSEEISADLPVSFPADI